MREQENEKTVWKKEIIGEGWKRNTVKEREDRNDLWHLLCASVTGMALQGNMKSLLIARSGN